MGMSLQSSTVQSDAGTPSWGFRLDVIDPNTNLWSYTSDGHFDITQRVAAGATNSAALGMFGGTGTGYTTNGWGPNTLVSNSLQFNIVANRTGTNAGGSASFVMGQLLTQTTANEFNLGFDGTNCFMNPFTGQAIAFPNYAIYITNTWIGANTYILPDSGIRFGALARNISNNDALSCAMLCVVSGTLDANYRATCYFGHETQGNIGSVIVNNTSAAISFPSDYRLKHSVNEIMDGLDLIGRLRPIYFNWKSRPNDARVRGFLAHEFQEVFPEAVKGTKDCVKIRRIDPEYQQLDSRKSIPAITSALKQLSRRLDRINTAIGA